MCDCIETVNKELSDRNTRLEQALMFGASTNPGLMLRTEQLEKGRGKNKAVTIFPSYCPFCGEKYADRDMTARAVQ